MGLKVVKVVVVSKHLLYEKGSTCEKEDDQGDGLCLISDYCTDY